MFVCLFLQLPCLKGAQFESNWNLLGSCVLLRQACVPLFSLPFGQELVPASLPRSAPGSACNPCLCSQHPVPEKGKALNSLSFIFQMLFCALTDLDQSQVLWRQSPAQICPLAVLRALLHHGPGGRICPSHSGSRQRSWCCGRTGVSKGEQELREG